MMMTTVLVMLLIWQINLITVTIFSLLFLGMESLFLSSLLSGITDDHPPLLHYPLPHDVHLELKYETEVKKKMSMEVLRQLGCNLGTVRTPGIGLLYNELVKGVPAIFGHFLTTLPTVHSMIIFVCIKYVPVPVVPQNERFLFRRVCSKGYHIFRCIARYGYKDVRKENHQIFQSLLIEKFIRREAQDRIRW